MLLQLLNFFSGLSRILTEEDHVGNRVSTGRAEHLVRQPIGTQELGLQAGTLAQLCVAAVAAAGAARRHHERRQAAWLELIQRAQDKVGLQRFALVLRVVLLVAAPVSQRAERHVADHGVIDFVRGGGGHALERADGGGIARAVIHQGVDATRCRVQFYRVHGGAQWRGCAEDAHARTRVQHLAASKAKLAQGAPNALGNRFGRVILVGRPLLAVGADQRTTVAGVAGQHRTVRLGQIFTAQLAQADLVQQHDGRIIGLLPLALGALLVELVQVRGLGARRDHLGRLRIDPQRGARLFSSQRSQLSANLICTLDQAQPLHDARHALAQP